jgi:hypothetical protein
MSLTLPADVAIDAEVDLNLEDGGYILRARLNVSLPGVKRSSPGPGGRSAPDLPVLKSHARQHRNQASAGLSPRVGGSLDEGIHRTLLETVLSVGAAPSPALK